MNGRLGCSAISLFAVFLIVFMRGLAPAAADGPYYLFTSFRGNGEDGLHLAISRDGYHWTTLNQDRSFLRPSVGKRVIVLMPDSPAQSLAQLSVLPEPRDVTTPMPVTTTTGLPDLSRIAVMVPPSN